CEAAEGPVAGRALGDGLGPSQLAPVDGRQGLEHLPLRAHTHEKPHALAREPVELDPRCAAAQWEMLETLPSVDGGELRWPEAIAEGSPCDGSFGGFAR
nr:hypothetical protein [Myxococcota bacterium]